MKLSKLTLASVGILLGINSLASCTGHNLKPSESSLTHDYADCTFEGLASDEQEKASTAVAVAKKAQRRTNSSSKPEQDSADCILPELE